MFQKDKTSYSLIHLVTQSLNRKGFTLSEVLITLGIIGMVAAMTIPNLMSNVQDKELITAWKKAFSDFSNAYSSILQEEGSSFVGICSDVNCIKNKFRDKMSVIKDCDNSVTNGLNKCIYDTNKLRYYGVPSSFSSQFQASGLILKNGMMVIFGSGNGALDATNSNCTTKYTSSNVESCGWIIVDVNGIKPPNTIGRDVFHIFITANSLVPVGAKDQNNSATVYNLASCTKDKVVGYGWGCSALFLGQ